MILPPKDFCKIIESQLQSYQIEIDTAKLKIQALENKNWKDKTLKSLQDENEQLKKSLKYGFGISSLKNQDIKQWQHEHIEKYHSIHHNVGMPSSHNFSYHFLPSSFGAYGFCRCETCYNHILKKIFSNPTISSLSSQEIHELAKENDIDFCFQVV